MANGPTVRRAETKFGLAKPVGLAGLSAQLNLAFPSDKEAPGWWKDLTFAYHDGDWG